MQSFIVIPARLASQRLPRKMLLAETGKPLVRHTYEAASRSQRAAGVVVATDHEEIFQAVRAFGGRAEMTDPHAASGTDRVAEIARNMPQVDLFVNVQGDEPEIAGETIDQLVAFMERHPAAPMGTLATPIRSRDKLENPACVKLVVNAQGAALYFSRSPIPHVRDWNDAVLAQNPPAFLQHLGVYAYRREFLLHWPSLPPSPLENLEKLEQLRVLSAGYGIVVDLVAHHAAGIDTAEDYRAFVSRVQKG